MLENVWRSVLACGEDTLNQTPIELLSVILGTELSLKLFSKSF